MRRFNFTDRKKLPTTSMKISQSCEDAKTLCVDVDLDFSNFMRPSIARLGLKVVLDAYGRVKFQRHTLGNISQRLIQSGIDFDQFFPSEIASFRVKVLDNSSKRGKIIAISRPLRLKTRDPEEQRSFLPIRVDDLDGVVYKIEFIDQCPTLVLNKSLDSVITGGIKNFSVHPAFVSLVFPEVVRQVLTRYLFIEGRTTDDMGHDDDFSDWMRCSLSLVPDFPGEANFMGDPTEIYTWIDRVVSRGAELNFMAMQQFQDLVERLK